MRYFVLTSACVLIVACKARAPSEGQPAHPTSTTTFPTKSSAAEEVPATAIDTRRFATPPSPIGTSSTSDLTRECALIGESNAANKASDYATARAKAAEAVAALLARPVAEQDEAWLALLNKAGRSACDAQDMRAAYAAWQRVFDIRSRTLPDDHPDLQWARGNLANILEALGDLAGARALKEKVFEVRSRTLPDDHPDLQRARGNLANTLAIQGDLQGARVLEEKVLEVSSRTLPDDHPDLQSARSNLASTLREQGDLQRARELQEKVLEVSSRTLPDDHPDLQTARQNLANTLFVQGDLERARALYEKVLKVCSMTLLDDHPYLQRARGNLAGELFVQGDMEGARALYEKVLEVYSRTLPDDHPDLQGARANLANTLRDQGDLQRARGLEEKVLEVSSRTLPEHHPDLQAARMNLANTLLVQGDLQGARVLQERVLEIYSRTLPEDHPDLQGARLNLANTHFDQGDIEGARALFEEVLEITSRTLPEDHPELQKVRLGLAATLHVQGDLQGARGLEEKVLEVFSRKLPEDHPDLQTIRLNLAATLLLQGDIQGARTLEETALEISSRTLPDDHPELQRARGDLARTVAAGIVREGWGGTRLDGERKRFVELAGAFTRGWTRFYRQVLLSSSSREAEERCAAFQFRLGESFSFAAGYGVFPSDPVLESQAFGLSETTRGAAMASAELALMARGDERCEKLRSELHVAVQESAGLVQGMGLADEFSAAVRKRDEAERRLVAYAREHAADRENPIAFECDALASTLTASDALVAYRRYTRSEFPPGAAQETSTESLCAFVVREGGNVERVEFGAIEPVEQVAREWRAALGAGESRGVGVTARLASPAGLRVNGERLRALIFDPLLGKLEGCRRLIVALDDVLHLVPLEVLPLADSRGLVGDLWRIETRATLMELSRKSPAPTGTALVAIGGASFNLPPLALSDEEVAVIEGPRPIQTAGLLRGTPWERGFEPLMHTGDEARGIGVLYKEIYKDGRPALVLERRKASREALEELAPRARWLHIATHGWFAPESIRSWSDPEPLDKKSGLGLRLSGEEQVKGMSPMLLCGLALAGANLPENAIGRVPGLITAEEISTLNLTNCELAVLSACDTNVGVRRAGQGVASLQKALQMAGARSVITSLWRVPDEATKELMLDFYRRLWGEKKPKWQALWEAKMKIRNEKDESGGPKYTTRDWAAWVLTGDPN
jgi:CHAT domain-containing protein/tetratricopeptide (TPR) repeat protein